MAGRSCLWARAWRLQNAMVSQLLPQLHVLSSEGLCFLVFLLDHYCYILALYVPLLGLLLCPHLCLSRLLEQLCKLTVRGNISLRLCCLSV